MITLAKSALHYVAAIDEAQTAIGLNTSLAWKKIRRPRTCRVP